MKTCTRLFSFLECKSIPLSPKAQDSQRFLENANTTHGIRERLPSIFTKACTIGKAGGGKFEPTPENK